MDVHNGDNTKVVCKHFYGSSQKFKYMNTAMNRNECSPGKTKMKLRN